jgi:hypothetical protein
MGPKRVSKHSPGIQERINPFYVDSDGKNSFGLRTFRFTNGLQEGIKFVNRGSTVYTRTYVEGTNLLPRLPYQGLSLPGTSDRSLPINDLSV